MKPFSLSSVAARLEEPGPVLGKRLPVWSAPCRCMREQTDTLCQLQQIEERQTPVEVDTLLTCANLVLETTDTYIRCTYCQEDSRTLMQVFMIFQTLFSWAQAQCHPLSVPCPEVSMTLGKHTMSRDESQVVRLVLVSRTLDQTSKALKHLFSRVDRLSAKTQGRQVLSSERANLENLRQYARALSETSAVLMKRLATQKERTSSK